MYEHEMVLSNAQLRAAALSNTGAALRLPRHPLLQGGRSQPHGGQPRGAGDPGVDILMSYLHYLHYLRYLHYLHHLTIIHQVVEAARLGAQIILLPEDGIHGYGQVTRETLR